MDAHQFDRLTKSLAGGSSRRRVLKGLSGAVGAAALAAVGRDAGRAAPGGNSACAHFCTAALPPGPERGRCVSDAAHGNRKGLCARCDADLSNYLNDTCCPSGQEACNYAACTGDNATLPDTFPGGTLCCDSGQTCSDDPSNIGYGRCTASCLSAPAEQSDCPIGSLCYYGVCYPYNEDHSYDCVPH